VSLGSSLDGMTNPQPGAKAMRRWSTRERSVGERAPATVLGRNFDSNRDENNGGRAIVTTVLNLPKARVHYARKRDPGE